MNDFDTLTPKLVEQAERDALPLVEAEDLNKRLELKERQLKELVDAFDRLNPEEALLGHYRDEHRKVFCLF